ncbi:MAG: DNA replication/repair protein RecF [Chloroflexi bacterium]|nr:DNA replication/repair protein RecF [Chloroflexota bacterium]
MVLTDFRNFARLHLTLSGGVTLLHGDNGQGKSNILEAIYLLAMARSFRARYDRDLVNWFARDTAGLGYFARVAGHVKRGTGGLRIEVILAAVEEKPDERLAVRKQVLVNGIKRTPSELIGLFNATLFSPDDVEIVVGSPDLRRRFLDIVLAQIDRQYVRALARYQRIVAQRNSLLRTIRDGSAKSDQLDFWDGEMAASASRILQTRARGTVDLQSFLSSRHETLSSTRAELGVTYECTLKHHGAATASIEDVREELRQARKQDVLAGVCTVGPHRDDLLFTYNQRPLASSSSRGQIRVATIALKLAEADLLAAHTRESPVLLLDDVFSELDRRHRLLLLEVVRTWEQAIVTTTDLDHFPSEFLGEAHSLRISESQVVET